MYKSELKKILTNTLSEELYERSETEVEELTDLIVKKLCEEFDNDIEDDEPDQEVVFETED
jgi:predicted house-cleaning noncanonical NTP pyrophosphatase (MazG superfamily)